jgi:hypothetical protein
MPIARPVVKKPVNLTLPWLHKKQREFVDDDSRFVTAACGSKTGKTFGLAVWIIRQAWNTEQGLFWWCAPVYKQAQIAFKLIGHLLPPERVHKRASAGEMVYELLYSNGKVRSTIDFRSAERPESLRGDGVHGAVIDEAGYWKRDSHVSVLTTLTRTAGKLRIISTPKGKNWFYEEWTKGWCFQCKKSNKRCPCPVLMDKDGRPKNHEYSSYQLPTSDNPIIKQRELDTLKANFTDRQYRQEILAEFLDDGAGVFSNLRSCQKAKLQSEPRPGKRYVLGIDWAKAEDYTVFVVMDRDLKKVVHMERHQGLDWNVNIDRAVRCAKKWNRASMIIDSTGLGDVIFDQVSAVYPFVEGFSIYNNDPKVKLIQRLQLAFERNEIQIPLTSQPPDTVTPYTVNEDPDGRLAQLGNVLEGELQMYNSNVTKTGKFQFAAPEGYNDDCVIALALAVWKVSEEQLVYTFDSIRGV